jgi:hypothetical protein
MIFHHSNEWKHGKDQKEMTKINKLDQGSKIERDQELTKDQNRRIDRDQRLMEIKN